MSGAGSEYLMKVMIGALMAFVIFPVRQYARNWMAVKLGDNTPVLEGKLTLNPLAHLDPIGCIIMILVGFGWGRSATINPRNFKCKNLKLGMLAVALAGPVANLIFGFVMIVTVIICAHAGVSSVLLEIFRYIAVLNVNIAVFLLLPVPGFDGGDIVMQFLPVKFLWKTVRYMQYVSMIMIILFVFGPLRGVVSYIVGIVYTGLAQAAVALCSLFLR